MFKLLFLTLALLPFAELYLLWRIGHAAGWELVLALVVIPALIGSSLARKEGTRVLRRWSEAIAQRRMPEEGLLGGLLVLVGGVLLVIPGVLSDVLGLVLLFPPTRRLVGRWVRRGVERRIASGSVRVVSFSTTSSPFPGTPDVAPPRASPRPRIERGNRGEVDAEFTEGDERG
ncbi:FxsA family protein [Melittangium boletus]|uniref:Exclusion protein FxsA n=1 Tax=Melittangium boletus DSM 14713 TaxID=1294270 RepID=A0A250IA02_9BACT|nr:FxsA family protein [Melittangium boletus]ATB27786.1 exclusion protein FxsA [Melittangium boletus DSM 14713]